MAAKKKGFTPEQHQQYGQQLKDMKETLLALDLTSSYRTDSKQRREWNKLLRSLERFQLAMDSDAYQQHPDTFENDWYIGHISVGNNL